MTRHTRRRLATVAAAPLVALAVWASFRLAGVSLSVSGPGNMSRIGAGDVLFASLVSALAGWLVVRLLEQHASRPQRTWAMIASTALAVSLIGPSRLADGGSAAALIALHVVTAVVVTVGFLKTLPCEPRSARRRDRRARALSEGNSAG